MGYTGSGDSGFSKQGWWKVRGWWALALLGLIALVPLPVQAQKKPSYVLTVVATDDPARVRKMVPVLTSGDKFVEVFVPAATPVVRRSAPKKRLTLASIKTGWQFTCAGDWTDATRSVFRVTAIVLEHQIPASKLRERVARACDRLTTLSNSGLAKKEASTKNKARTLEASDGFVVEVATLERNDNLPVQKGTEYPAYQAEGTLRNISGQAYREVIVEMSILDRDRKKVADQKAIGKNVRAGDHWKFRAEPPTYLIYRVGHTVRVDRIIGTTDTTNR
jgi:hypothetical protein